jgi:hypothetical protein
LPTPNPFPEVLQVGHSPTQKFFTHSFQSLTQLFSIYPFRSKAILATERKFHVANHRVRGAVARLPTDWPSACKPSSQPTLMDQISARFNIPHHPFVQSLGINAQSHRQHAKTRRDSAKPWR